MQYRMKTRDIHINKGILDLEKKLNLPKDFFKNLLEEDDWSFIIKLHALVEAACGSLLLRHFAEPGLKHIISRLELSNKTTGKIVFLKELGLLGETNRRFVSSLSEWRNKFVHNVHNCNSKLQEIVDNMDKDAIKKFAVDFSPYESNLRRLTNITVKSPDDKKIKLLDDKTIAQLDVNKLIERSRKNPKMHIWLGAYNMLTSLVEMEDYSDYLKYEKASRFLYEIEEE